MFVFRLPIWVVKEIDKIRRDFFWKGPELGSKGVHLVAWNRTCGPRNMGGWGILNLQTFNKALLGKWWWKIYYGHYYYWSKIIHLNYLNSRPPGPLLSIPPRNKFFFWVGIMPISPSFRVFTSKTVQNSATTLCWYDNWLEGKAPKDLWPDLFSNCTIPWASIRHSHKIFPLLRRSSELAL